MKITPPSTTKTKTSLSDIKNKLFLIDFSSAILIEVAKKLKKEGVEILYWTGRKNNFEQARQNKKDFSGIIFHNNLDAVQGVPPQELKSEKFSPPGNNLINEMLECESLVLTMMTRLDFWGKVPFLKKKHLYYKYLQYWNGALEKFKPNAIVFRSVPHSSYNFVLYCLAKKKGILTIMFDSSVFKDKLLTLEDFKKMPEEFLEMYERLNKENNEIMDLPEDKQEYFRRLSNPVIDATPDYKKKVVSQMDDPVKTIPPWRKIIKNIKNGNFIPALRYHLKSALNLTSRPIFTIDETDKADYRNVYQLKKIIKITEKYKTEYKELQKEVDFKKEYIYFPLHYQPECNTSPVGGHFADQILAVKILASALPPGWKIYAKENIAQWNQRNAQANSFRYAGYYRELAEIENVSLLAPEVSSYDLIANSQAIATISGTAGWEALARNKPVLFFGFPWYQYCGGSLRVNSVEDCQKAISEVISGFKPNHQKTLNYLIALDRTTIRASHVEYLERASGVPREESIKAITECLWRKLIKDKIHE